MAQIKITKEQKDLLTLGSVIKVNKPERKDYYYLPYWFEHDIETDEWRVFMLEKLPEAVKKTIHELRNK